MLDTLFLSGNSMNLTKIYKIVRQFFNLSKIEEEIHFLVCMGGRSNCHKGEKLRIYRAEGPKIAVFAP
jgi:hypothetical protein